MVEALNYRPTGAALNCVTDYEKESLDESDEKETIEAIGFDNCMSLYVEEVKWVKSLNY